MNRDEVERVRPNHNGRASSGPSPSSGDESMATSPAAVTREELQAAQSHLYGMLYRAGKMWVRSPRSGCVEGISGSAGHCSSRKIVACTRSWELLQPVASNALAHLQLCITSRIVWHTAMTMDAAVAALGPAAAMCS